MSWNIYRAYEVKRAWRVETMKPINEITGKLNNQYSGSIKWTDIYDSEEELVNDLLHITIRKIYPNPTQGYEYLSSFQNRLKAGNSLTDKQMTMLKRLAYVVAYEKYCRVQENPYGLD